MLCADARRPTLRQGTVDVVVTDLPFGKRCLEKNKLPAVYSRVLAELARILRPGSGRAVLMTKEAHLVLAITNQAVARPYWRNAERCFVRHGPADGWSSVIRVERSAEPFQLLSKKSRKRNHLCYVCGGQPLRRVGASATELVCECGGISAVFDIEADAVAFTRHRLPAAADENP